MSSPSFRVSLVSVQFQLGQEKDSEEAEAADKKAAEGADDTTAEEDEKGVRAIRRKAE